MPDILKRLDLGRGRLLEKISSLDEENFARRPSAHEWSVAEIVEHLSLVEQRVIKELEQGLKNEPRRLPLLRRMIPTRIVASRVIKVKAPRAVVPTNGSNKVDRVKAFNDTRSKLKALYEANGAERLAQTVFKHPFLGEITGLATISFVAYHEQRHYKQICEVMQKIAAAQ